MEGCCKLLFVIVLTSSILIGVRSNDLLNDRGYDSDYSDQVYDRDYDADLSDQDYDRDYAFHDSDLVYDRDYDFDDSDLVYDRDYAYDYSKLLRKGGTPKWAKRWTLKEKNCPCWWDLNQTPRCACCRDGGVACGFPMHKYCMRDRSNRKGCPGNMIFLFI